MQKSGTPPLNTNDNNVNLRNIRLRGFSIETLDSMMYNQNDQLVDGEFETINIPCNYILPKSIKRNDMGLSIMSFNIRGMFSNFVNFTTEIVSSDGLFDIIGVCETHLTESTDKLYNIPGLKFYTTNVSSNKGGVGIFVNENITCKVREDLRIARDHIEVIFIESIIENKPLLFGMLYRRPGTLMERFFEDLSTVLQKVNHRCVLMGDFNLNLLNEEHNIHVQNFVNIMRQFSYTNVITKPTRVFKNSATLIDHLWLNFEPHKDSTSKIIFSGITDHFPVVLDFICSQKHSLNKVITYRKSGQNCDEEFKRRLEQSDFSEIIDSDNVDRAFEILNEIMSNLFNECYPLVTRTISKVTKKKPWLTPGIIQSIKTKNKLYKKFVKKPITYGHAYRQYRNNLTKIIKASKNNFYRQQFHDS